MIRANSRHVGSPSRSEREEFSRTSNWRSSLRSTKEQRGYENGNGFRSSLRSYTDKENQVKSKATRGEPKTPTKAVENPPAKEKKSEPKTDVANRAKKKFLEHLSKFQKESKATGFNVNRNNNFYRSYRKPNEDKESPGLRRSYRVPASKPSVKAEPTGISSNPGFKRPQRKDKTSESQLGGTTKENTSKSVRSVKSESTSSIKYDSDHSSLDFSVKANVGSCNSSRPTSASSTVTSDSSRSASSGAKKSTRAELAMERHMDRMRKASQNSPTSNPPYNRSASSSKLRQKSTTEAERIDDVISPTRFTIPKETTTRQSNSNQDDKSLSELIDDWIIEGLSDTSFTLNDFASGGSKPKKSSTTSATEPGKLLSPKPKSSTVIPEWNSVNIVEDDVFDVTASPLKKRDSASKIEVSTPHRKNSTSKLSSKTPVATLRSASKTSQGDVTPSDESALSHRLLTSQNSSDRLNKAGWNEKTEPDLVILETDELGTSPTASKIKHVTSKPPTPVKHGKAKSPAKLIESPTFSSGEPKLAKKRRSREQPTETEINYSVEEAIDTFRRLSEEIDSIKERGFRPSLLDSDRKPTSKKDKTRKVVSPTSPVKTVAPPIKSAPNSDSVATGAIIASGEPLAVFPDSLESSCAVATKPAPLEPEKVAATLQIASDKPAHDSKGALSAGRSRGGSTSQPGDAQEQGVGEKRTQRSSSLSGHKQEDQNSSIGREDVRLVRSNENNTVQPARSCTAEAKTVVATPQAEKDSHEAKTPKIKQTRQRASTLPEVMPNQPAKRTLSKAEKIQRLRIAVAKYSYTPASSDDESLISDGNGSDDEDPSWLNDSDTDSSLSSFGSVKKSKFVSSRASHVNKKSDANGRQDLSEDSQASTRYNGANNDISTPESPKSAAHERPPVDNEKKVGAMLSMWENKKAKPKSAFDASEDDAFDNSTKGRLHGAKALFENMTKNPKTYSSSVENEIETTGITGSKKSLFENLAKSPQRAEPQTHSPKKPPSVHSSDYDVDDVISDASLSSASSDEEEEKSEGNEQDEKKEAPSVNNVRQMWERKLSVRVKKTPTKTRDPSLQEIVRSDSQHDDVVTSVRDVTAAWESGSKKAQSDVVIMEKSPSTSSGKPPPAKTSTGKSNIQSKIAARKKRERRSMTQPITGDDVTAAKELVKNSKDPADVGSDEEEELSFADRLIYFNQLCAKPSPAKTQQKLRTGFKRFNTQPVNRDDIVEAKKLYNNKSSVKDSSEISTSLSDLSQTATKIPENLISKDPLNKSSNSVSIVDLINPEIEPVPSFEEDLCNTSSEDSSKIDEPKSRGRETTKVGKLADDLKLKFAKNQEKPSVESPTRKPHSPSRVTDSSAVAKQQLRKRSPSPLVVRKLSSASSSAGSSSDSGDMGKEMEREIKSTGSIHDRLKLLQKNQEEDWKRRVKKDNRSGVKSSLGERKNRLQDNEDKWKDGKGDSTPNVPRGSTVSKSNISDRLNSILANSEKWKAKSGKQNDATQFTVQAKAHKREGSTGVPMTSSPSLKRKVLPVPIGNQPVVTIDDVTNEMSSLSKLSEVLKLSQKGLEEDVIKTLDEATQEIPMMTDSDFDNFFSSNTDVILSNGQDLNGTDEMMDSSDQWLELEDSLKLMRNKPLSDLGRLKSSVKRHSSRNKRSTRNPVKALAAREDIKQSYTEQRSNVSKLEQQRLASRGGNFTSAALAGLAHKADFSKVNLKSTTQPAFTANDLQPWSDKMLLRVKGRRHVQTRLVDPCCASLNSGDAYLLITSTQLFAWFGEFANVIEKAKVQEIADYIIHKGDMGSKATSLTIIEETQSTHLKSKPFFTLIGGEGIIEPYGGDKEDEIYEVNSEAAIKSYKLKDEKLVPHSEAWGKLPSMRMLDTKDTYVFDFGGEMYIWQGKEVSFSDRQLAVRLARTLWDQGYDYSDIGFCPFGPISSASINLKGPRPEWGLFARVNENLETALIQEKFEDWSNISREVGDREELLKESSRGQLAVEMQTKVSIKPEMVACDIKQMTSEKLHPLPLHLEGHNVWRGHGHIYDDDGRGLLVVTSAVDTWYATEKNMIKVEKPLHGVFHRSETYVVRWKYVVSSTGKWLASKSQPGVDLKAAANGRERTSYFMWAGRDSSVNEKGASALMATEIDKDGGAQITVHEGREPPAFVQCFNGGMTVVDGKIGKREGFYSWKLFCIRGSIAEETALYQVPCEFQSLRSRSSFILFNGRLAKIVVWHGVCSSKSTRELIMEAANKMKETKAECLGFRSSCKNAELSVCEEGKENADFSEGMGRVRRTKYVSLLDTPDPKPSVPRVWHLLPSGDHFVAHELPPVLEYPSDENDKSEDIEIFPIIQEQLTELSKPALVLVNGTEGVFLWQSVGGEDMKGSGKRQFDISRRLAMETTINYCKEHRPDCTPILINEKHEPMEFTNSFPVWLESKQKFSFEERRAKKPKPVAEVLGSLSRLTYSLEELRAPSLPEGVDPNHLETYLSTEDFEKLFQITKEEFYAMPPWKQHNLRKEKNLF